jgi:3-phenylpropionate/trans-cinnamate dioxygenase ferredoxin subunit
MSCSLDDGELVDGQVQCLCHGSVFDLTTGEPTELPATEPIRVYPVRVEADDVFVSLE